MMESRLIRTFDNKMAEVFCFKQLDRIYLYSRVLTGQKYKTMIMFSYIRKYENLQGASYTKVK